MGLIGLTLVYIGCVLMLLQYQCDLNKKMENTSNFSFKVMRMPDNFITDTKEPVFVLVGTPIKKDPK